MNKIVVEFPISNQLPIIADYLEERGLKDCAEVIRTGLNNLPKFEVGDIVRFGDNPIALMEITHIHTCFDFGYAYAGNHFSGNKMAVYETQIFKPLMGDLEIWSHRNPMMEFGENPIYGVGEIVRYDSGPTALMEITDIHDYGGSMRNGRTQGYRFRYYGTQVYGGSVGVFEEDCSRLSRKDLGVWNEERKIK